MEGVAKSKALKMFMDACDATPVYGYEEAKRSLFPRCGASNSLLLSHPSPKKQTNDFEVSKVICNEKTSTLSTGKCCLFCPVSEIVEASDSLGPPGKYAKLWTMSFGSRSALMLEYPDSLCASSIRLPAQGCWLKESDLQVLCAMPDKQ